MVDAGSLVVRRQLGAKLRRLRDAAGKSMADVKASGLASPAKLSRIENGQGPVKIADVRALCWLYNASSETTDALAALAPGTQEEDWWQPLGAAVVPEWFGLYAGLEATANQIRCFEPQLVHGLVQTADYARAVIGVDSRLDPDVVEQRVRFRLQRQQTQADITVIMGEGALLLVAGSETVMSAQVDHLREVSANVRVLPFSAGVTPRRHAFAALDFDDADDPSVVYVESPAGARYYDKPDERAEYEHVWQIIFAKSVPIGEWTQ
jgi:hypothetical protein